MRDVTLRFINALRAAGLRVSLSESMDAMQAVAAVGVERELLCEALAASLVKEEEDRPIFDETFARFFVGPGSQRKGKHKEQAGSGDGSAKFKVQGSKSETKSPKSKVQSPKSENQQIPSSKFQVPSSQSAIRNSSDPRPPTPSQARLVKQKILLEKPFKAFDTRDVEAAKELVEDLARRLHGRLSRRYKRRKRGRLDFRRTIRASIAHGGVPIELLLRGRRPGKPDLVALCDLSGSVAVVSDFLLALLAPAAEYFRRVRTFAYVDRLCEVSFEQGHVVPHERLDLYAFSDFGKVLQHFWQDYGEGLLTRNTLVLILGDARNNRRPPRPDLLARMRDHAQKLIWLNPEPRERWNTGDSVINRYAPACDAVLEC
ncbi:MAG: VWA domain-containing protein, partial [Candidatus Binatia bacterium]